MVSFAKVHAVLDRMADFANRVRPGAWTGYTGQPIRTVVNIGIGGSGLGPVMAYEGLRFYSDRRLDCGSSPTSTAPTSPKQCTTSILAETLFIVSSKTFTTLETITNAATARA